MAKGLESQPRLFGSDLCIYQYITTRDSTVPVFVYSYAIEPLVYFITHIFSQFWSLIVMVVIKVHLILKRNESKDDQKCGDRCVYNKFVLTDMNYVDFCLTVMDLIELYNDQKRIETNA
ncbi:hypothetical protein RF11_02356 [Thelohanellus kitauei]|uniref:Uncharacterized protein n=1 Tax=Thelohanellus kitauei TaxID=669202 RepID=A0A0C2MC26_THEKT|nr:hypothetical protein RF11_12290 [Thelohanellus kitauei]KII73368.1 hypothetical protein RF11_02356 [Thelohanellus kitauei]